MYSECRQRQSDWRKTELVMCAVQLCNCRFAPPPGTPGEAWGGGDIDSRTPFVLAAPRAPPGYRDHGLLAPQAEKRKLKTAKLRLR